MPNSSTVEFTDTPNLQGTELTVIIEVEMPAGRAKKLAARLFDEDPAHQVRDDLRHFKQILETGEIIYSETNPADSQTKRFVKQRAAQPLTDREFATIKNKH